MRGTRSQQEKFPEVMSEVSRHVLLRADATPHRQSVNFVDLHGGVDGEIGIANGRAGRCGRMMRSGREFAAETFDGVGVAVALGAGHGKRTGGHELVERSAMAVDGDVGAFRLGDLQEVASNADQGDGLRGRRALVSRRHFLQKEVVNDKEKGGTYQKADKRAHEEIVARLVARFKQDRNASCVRKQRPSLAPGSFQESVERCNGSVRNAVQ